MEQDLVTEEIWREFHARLLAYIRRQVGSIEDAKDILQEVFLRVHDSLRRRTPVRSVTKWIFQITHNAIVDHHRAQAKEATAMEEVRTEAGRHGESPRETAAGAADRTEELARCLDPLVRELPEHYGQSVALTDLGGMTQEQAARRLGLSVSGMKSRVQRGRGKMKEMLLACCDVELDRRRGVVDFHVVDPDSCGGCGCC